MDGHLNSLLHDHIMREFLRVWSSLGNTNVCNFYLYQLPAPANQEKAKDNSVIAHYQVPNNKMQQNFKEKSNHLKKTLFARFHYSHIIKIFLKNQLVRPHNFTDESQKGGVI